jgi:hypothetical protein
MRAKFLFAIFCVAGAIVTGLFLLRREESDLLPGSSQVPVPPNLSEMESTNLSVSRSPEPSPEAPANQNVEKPEAASSDEIILQLHEYSMQEDPKYLALILSHMTNSNAEIREAALEATMQFGNRDAIPALKELAAKTDDPREKVKILDAIEFLELPSFSEIRKPRKE